MNLISTTDASRVEQRLNDILAGRWDAPDLVHVGHSIRNFVMLGGKRLRPQLCIWAYNATASDKNAASDTVIDIACAWELFHAFLLVHDDLIDNAASRRGGATLHGELDAQFAAIGRPIGRNLAIVAGDLLFGRAVQIFHDLEVSPSLYRRLLRLFSRITCTTGMGQAMDIHQSNIPLDEVCQETLLREYHWKTAAYTFEGPILSGALMAGLDDNAAAALSRFAQAIGQAYQIQNDILDLHAPASEGCDLVQQKRTLTLIRARRGMSPRQRNRFDRDFTAIASANGHAVALAEGVRCQLLAAGAIDQSRRLVDEFLGAARAATRDDDLPPVARAALAELLDLLQLRYFIPQCAD